MPLIILDVSQKDKLLQERFSRVITSWTKYVKAVLSAHDKLKPDTIFLSLFHFGFSLAPRVLSTIPPSWHLKLLKIIYDLFHLKISPVLTVCAPKAEYFISTSQVLNQHRLHSQMVKVCCAISSIGITNPYIKVKMLLQSILMNNQFLTLQLNMFQQDNNWFQQDNAISHTTEASIDSL